MNLQAEIEAQRERVDLAWAMWQQTTDELFEHANWLAYKAAMARLDALYAAVKREKLLA